jgi:hypothetical protein
VVSNPRAPCLEDKTDYLFLLFLRRPCLVPIPNVKHGGTKTSKISLKEFGKGNITDMGKERMKKERLGAQARQMVSVTSETRHDNLLLALGECKHLSGEELFSLVY